MRSLKVAPYFIAALVLATACTPTTFTRTRIAWKPYDEREYKQQKERVTVEMKTVQDFPEVFYASVQACDQSGRPVADPFGKPIMERVSFVSPGQFWQQVAITNQTDHVIRFNNVAIRVFDPSGDQSEPLTRDDLVSMFFSRRPCRSSELAVNRFRGIKILDRNMEIVPGTTATSWIAFRPPSMQTPGIWKFAFYDIPVQVDQAGRTTKAARFEMRSVATMFTDTYVQDNLLSPPQLIETKETPN
jgi:hypothetical protein